MDLTDVAGAAAAGVLFFIVLSVISFPLVPALMLSCILTAALIGKCRQRARENPPG